MPTDIPWNLADYTPDEIADSHDVDGDVWAELYETLTESDEYLTLDDVWDVLTPEIQDKLIEIAKRDVDENEFDEGVLITSGSEYNGS